MTHRIILDEGDIAAAVNAGLKAHCKFGPSGAWVDVDDEQPLTPFVEYILLRRGITNQNLAGAGI